MYDLQRAIALALPNVIGKVKHEDYPRTLEIAREYKAFTTGRDLEFMLRRFDRRESEEDFKQANRIAQYITKPIVAGLMNPARKVSGVRPIVDRVDYGKEDQKSGELRDMLSEWYGGKSVSEYMSTLIDPSDVDPNAFVVLTFEEFDYRKAKPTVFPVKVGCENVYGFRYVNGELAHLFLGFAIQYVTKPASVDAGGKVIKAEMADGMRFVMYTAEHHIVFEQVRKELAPNGPKEMLVDADGTVVSVTGNAGLTFTYSADEDPMYFLRATDETVYAVKVYEQKSGRVPAFRLGCKPDALTDGRTCVNRWDEAVPYLKKSLKQVRELDLTTALHVFPQKSEYVNFCRAKGCKDGYDINGSECSTCKGTGFVTIATAQDHKQFKLPKDPSDPIWPLAELTHYTQLPVELIAQMRDIVRETRSDCFRAVYGSDLYSQGNTGKTYEEVIAMNQAQYDALKPLADWWSETTMTITHVWANYNDKGTGLVVINKLPRSFGFETAADAFRGIKAAKEAGASKAITANLDAVAIDILFRDDSDALQKAKVQAKFDPFPGMSPETITSLISGGKTTDRSALMWTEAATVWRKAEAKYPGEVSFYDLAESKQQEVIDEILDEMLMEKDERAAARAPQFAPQLGMDDTTDQNEDEEVDPSGDQNTDQAASAA